ncbi:hypothetical protein [Bacillus massiliglaciei]|nr:hypothetical protein [Bacillus massiliglaciei]
MNECFYCSTATDDKKFHQVSFHLSEDIREEILCDECYQEWLQGIKG